MRNKKSGKFKSVAPKRKVAKKLSHIRLSPSQNLSESQYSCIFQELMNRGKYAFMGLYVNLKYGLGKSCCVCKIPPVMPKKQTITVSVFLSTLQQTALLSKNFRLRLHCYTLLIHTVSIVADLCCPFVSCLVLPAKTVPEQCSNSKLV